MKFLHIADLHIGRKLNEHSLAEDQRHILRQILSIIEEQNVDGLLIAGDVYDKPIPSEDAVTIFDEFLTNVPVPSYIISGNHDSADRLGFGNKIFERFHIHITDRYDGTVPAVDVEDESGPLTIYLLPFIRTGIVKRLFPDAVIETLDDAVHTVVSHIPLDTAKRNVILVHQFVVHGTEKVLLSEETSVGDIDNISSDIFKDFDYVALGHLHGAQHIGRETVRYAGSPLKYSKAEITQEKSVTLVELKEKGNTVITAIPLKPLHEVREITGTLDELVGIGSSFDSRDDYLYVTIKGIANDANLQQKIANAYPNYLSISFADTIKADCGDRLTLDEISTMTPEEIFGAFYEQQTGGKLSKNQEDIVHAVFEEVRGGAA